VRSLLKKLPSLQFSISVCTRPIRPGEKEGENYYYVDEHTFLDYIKEDKFLEWEKVYASQFYGTLRSEVEVIRKKGRGALFDVDVKGGIKLKNLYPDTALAIFIKAPSLDVLQSRLRKRSTESEESILKRIGRAKEELEFEKEFNTTIINETINQAQSDVYTIVKAFIKGNK